MKRWIFIFILLLTSGCAGTSPIKHSPAAAFGMLDLSGWDLYNDGVAWFNGKWELYYGKLLTPEDFLKPDRPLPTGYVTVPGDWRDCDRIDPLDHPAGFATLRLVVRTEDAAKTLGITYQNFKNIPHKFWVDGELVSSDLSNVNDVFHKLPGFYTVADVFIPKSDTIEIVLQLSNYYNVPPFSLGTESRVIFERYRFFFKTWFYFLLFGGLLIMIIYNFGMYIFRKKDKAPLYFALFSLCVSYGNVGALLAAFSPALGGNFNLYSAAVKMTPLINYLALWALMKHYGDLFPDTFPKKSARVVRIALLSLFAVFALIPVKYLGGLLFVTPYALVIPGSTLFLWVVLGRSVRFNKENTAIIFFGFVPFVLAVIFDAADMILLLAGKDAVPYYVVPSLTYVYIVFQSVLLSRRTSYALTKVEEMTRDLEKLVGLRTTELEIERNRLESQNLTMQEELNLARRIQMQFIPSAAPEQFAFFYKPMYQIGGDYFDFIRCPDGKIGVFISDVSGHGVPAAFVTSMIKSFTLENMEKILKPSEYLTGLNDFLLPLTAGNFITAFYGIYDPKERSLVYSSAGHNAPFLITPEKVTSIYVKNGLPLAVVESAKMQSMGKGYRENRIEFAQGDKVFFYTDGLTETVSIYQSDAGKPDAVVDFESIGLMQTFQELKNQPAKALIAKMMERLTQFRGADVFDDDVCIICLEVV